MTEIRLARAADGPRLREIDLETWDSRTTPAPRPSSDRPFFDDKTAPEDVLVAEAAGAVVGYLFLEQTLPVPSHTHVLTINGLAVSVAGQGRGVGRALVEEAVRQGRLRDAQRLTLRVLGHNTAARRLYERCGFVVEGVLVGEFMLDGQPVDDVLMARTID